MDISDNSILSLVRDPYVKVDPRSIGVIMPFNAKLDTRYRRAIKEPLEKEGYTVRRTDELLGAARPVMGNILDMIQHSGLVIADISGHNPNVMLELGLACGVGKQILLIAESPLEVPVDLRLLTFVKATSNLKALSEKVARCVDEYVKHRHDYTAITPEQRLMQGCSNLGIIDIYNPKSDVATAERVFDFVEIARHSFLALGLSARSLFSTEPSILSEKARRIVDRGVELDVIIADPDSPHVAYFAALEGLSESSFRDQLRTSIDRLRRMGTKSILLTSEFYNWAGVIVDDSIGLIQYFRRDRFNTPLIICKNNEQGAIFESFVDQLSWIKANSRLADSPF